MADVTTRATSGLAAEIRGIRELAAALDRSAPTGLVASLPGNAWFLDDGRVLCRARQRGDSRYPYGRNGLQLWVHASGYIHANDGRYFLFLPTPDGHEPQVAFFVGLRRTDGTYTPISLLPVPVVDESSARLQDRYTVLGHDAAYFVAETDELVSAVRVFVGQENPGVNAGALGLNAGAPGPGAQVIFSLYLESRSPRALELYQSAYMNPFCRNQFAETCEDRWFKRVSVEPASAEPGSAAGALPPFQVAVNEDVSRFRSVTNRMLVRRSFVLDGGMEGGALQAQVCTSRRGYTGDPRRGLAQALFLRKGELARDVRLTVFNDNAIVGDLNRFRLPAGATARFDYVISLPADEAAEGVQLGRLIDAERVDAGFAVERGALESAEHDLDLRIQGLALDGVSAETFNWFFPYLREQVRTCAETKGFVQPSPNSLIGIRDVFQAIEGHVFDQPASARAKIREALGYVLVNGRCPRQYSLPVNGIPGPVDPREFVDQGAWVISTLYTYVGVTGDRAFLDERVGYHVLDGDGKGIRPAAEEDTVIEHLLRIAGYLLRHREPQTGLLRALYGDWNDALDGLGTTTADGREFGTGVSVMASLQLYRNCAELLELLAGQDSARFQTERAMIAQARADLRDGLLRYAVVQRGGERRILHGWGDARGYFVGGFEDVDGEARDGLTSNAFWVLAGMLAEDPALRLHILAAFERLDSPYGLRTFAPGFAPDAAGVGRISKLPLGTAENGATYVHATAFGVMALFLLNEPRRAWEQIRKVLPFSPHQQGLSHSPFVMPNSYVYNPGLGLTGQNMNDWQTGSANVLLKALIWYVFGFRPGLEGLRIAPASWCPMTRYEFCGRAHGRRVRLRYAKGGMGQRQVFLRERALPIVPDPATTVPSVLVAYDELSPDDENVVRILDPE